MKSLVALALTVLALPVHAGTALSTSENPVITVNSPGLYPEGIAFDAKTGEFLLGSIRKGMVVAVSTAGVVRPFVQDQRLRSVVGIRFDAARNRLLIANSDYGVAERSGPTDNFSVAGLGIYDASTGAPLQFVDLSALRPNDRRFINDLDVDAAGNVYLTDSLSAAILKVTPAGVPSVFLTHERFRGDGFNLNGIQVHPDGFLLVAKKSDGALFRVPLDNPEAFTEVRLPEALVGTDGLVLTSKSDLIAIANRTGSATVNRVYHLTSADDWRTARIVSSAPLEDTYASTGTVAGGRVVAIHGRLHTLPGTLRSGSELAKDFQIKEIARVR